MDELPEAVAATPIALQFAAQVALAAGVGLCVSIVLAGVALLLA